MVWSQLLYCTQIWNPHLMKDILTLEQIQHRGTKYLLNDYTSSYKTHLVKLRILPLMYLLELQDIKLNSLGHIKLIISFSSSGTQNSGARGQIFIWFLVTINSWISWLKCFRMQFSYAALASGCFQLLLVPKKAWCGKENGGTGRDEKLIINSMWP